MTIISILAGLATGLVLGVFGSGGGIITTPALLYLVHVPAKSAIAMSLGVIAVTATVATFQHWRRGNVNLKITLIFGLFSVSGTYLGARLGVYTPVVVQLAVFSLVMYAAAWKMLRPMQVHRSAGAAAVSAELCTTSSCMVRTGAIGVGVGILAGLVGVGGGFMIVPALVLLSGLPIKQAIGTALAIVTLNSASGFVGYAGHISIDYALVATFAAIAIAGSVVGSYLAHRLPAEHLKRAFGIFLVFAASAILLKSVL